MVIINLCPFGVEDTETQGFVDICHDTRAEVWRVVWQGKKVVKWGEIYKAAEKGKCPL